MRNEHLWKPTKFISDGPQVTSSVDPVQVAPTSRIVATLAGRKYAEALKSYASGQLLDLGCGFVPLYSIYREYVESVTCVDWANTLHPSPHLDLEVDLNQPIPLETDRFDTILLTDVLEHIAEPSQLMSEIARLLKPDGKLILGVPFLYWIHEAPHDYYRMTEFALKRLSSNAGLEVLALSPYGGLPEVLADLTGKMMNYVPGRLGRFLVGTQRTMAALLLTLGIAKKLSRASARNFPLGYLMVCQKRATV
jgi:SAM-dependent methyltransferase